MRGARRQGGSLAHYLIVVKRPAIVAELRVSPPLVVRPQAMDGKAFGRAERSREKGPGGRTRRCRSDAGQSDKLAGAPATGEKAPTRVGAIATSAGASDNTWPRPYTSCSRRRSRAMSGIEVDERRKQRFREKRPTSAPPSVPRIDRPTCVWSPPTAGGAPGRGRRNRAPGYRPQALPT